MHKIVSLLFSLLIVITAACAPAGAGRRASEDARAGGREKVTEDLSVYRPTYPAADAALAIARIVPSNHVNERLAVLMDTVASLNKNIKYAQGYRILAYNGSERQKVMDLRKAIIRRLPEESDYLTYQQPNFRLMIGDYFSRVEAQQVLNRISDLIPNAQILQEQINVPKK